MPNGLRFCVDPAIFFTTTVSSFGVAFVKQKLRQTSMPAGVQLLCFEDLAMDRNATRAISDLYRSEFSGRRCDFQNKGLRI